MGLLLCTGALLVCFLCARRSLIDGIISVMAVGYLYGIVRANFPDTASHFIFDAAVLGLYIAQIKSITQSFSSLEGQRLKHWVVFLILWPIILFLVPIQDPLVQLVGLRGNIFLLPFILFGARLRNEELYKLALWLAIFNVGSFVVGCSEYAFGL